MRSTVLKKVAAGLVLALPVLLALDYLQYQSIHVVVVTHKRLVRISGFLRQIQTTRSLLREAESATRDYVANGETVALNTFQTSVAKLRDSLGGLEAMVGDNSRQKERAQKLLPLVTRRTELLQQTVDLRGQKEFSIEKARALDAQGRKLAGDIQTLIEEIERNEEDLLKRRNEEAKGSVQRATFITPFTAILGLWLVALAALLLYRDAGERKWTGIERRMHAKLLESLPVSVCLVDESGLIFYTNPAEDALFGYESGDMIGRHVALLQSAQREEGTQAFDNIFEQITLHGRWTGELECRKKDSSTFPCLVRACAMELPGKMYRVFTLQDLTEWSRR